jgi:hypothetical protein
MTSACISLASTLALYSISLAQTSRTQALYSASAAKEVAQ